jgi:hypothetical protein
MGYYFLDLVLRLCLLPPPLAGAAGVRAAGAAEAGAPEETGVDLEDLKKLKVAIDEYTIIKNNGNIIPVTTAVDKSSSVSGNDIIRIKQTIIASIITAISRDIILL